MIFFNQVETAGEGVKNPGINCLSFEPTIPRFLLTAIKIYHHESVQGAELSLQHCLLLIVITITITIIIITSMLSKFMVGTEQGGVVVARMQAKAGTNDWILADFENCHQVGVGLVYMTSGYLRVK